MSNDELPPPLPPPLPPGHRGSPRPVPVPVAHGLPPKPAAVPVHTPRPSPSPAASSLPVAATAPSTGGRLWWAWCLAGSFACFILFLVCLNCNPATTATDRALAKLQGVIAQQLDPQLHPLLSWGVSILFSNYLALPYAQMKAAGFAFASVVCLLLPAGCSLLSAALGHPLFMIGGAPGGWRATWQSFGVHRLVCDLASLLLIAFVLIIPLEPITAASLLILCLPMIRAFAMIVLWVSLARAHGFGPVRVIFLGLPHIFVVSACSGMVAFALAIYFYGYLVARSF